MASPRGEEVQKLAAQVFSTLAKGADVISFEDFKKCSTILAQVSDDFANEPTEAFGRMDLNGDNNIDLNEFLTEVRNISDMVGMRKVMSALEQVHSVAEQFSAKAEAEILEEEAATRRAPSAGMPRSGPARGSGGGSLRPPSGQMRPASGRSQSGTGHQPSAGGARPVFGGYPGAAGAGGLSLDISKKPLHPRGQRGRKESLRAREKVIENMLDYFKSLREEYERKLQGVKDHALELDGKEEVAITFKPKIPHGLVVDGGNGAALAEGPAGEGDGESGAGGAGAGSGAGMSGKGNRVGSVEPGSQAEEKGVEAEWLIDKVNDQDYTPEVLAAAKDGDEDYTVVFLQPGAGGGGAAGEDEPAKVFSGVTARPKKGAGDEEGEGDEDGSEDGGEEEGEDEEEDKAKASAKTAATEEEEEVEEEDEDDEAAAGDEAEEEEEDEEEDEEDEDDDDEDDEDEDEDDEDEDEEGGKAKGKAAKGSEKKSADADKAEQEQKKAAAAKDEAAAAAAAAAKDATDAKDDAAAAATSEEAKAKATGEGGHDADASKAAEEADASKAAEEAGGKKKEKKKKEKKPKEKKPKAPKRPSISPPPGDDAAAEAERGASPEPTATTKKSSVVQKKGKTKLEEEGVSCMQTLDMGLAIRSAICVGKEVWCADWKGAVTIRERDDASSVKAEIPTNRFIWCMAHQEPGLLWMGQESQGISLFHLAKKEFKTALTGGHTGGVYCLALDEGLGDPDEEGQYPTRRGWSGSNDFTIRQWWIETWANKVGKPEKVKNAGGKYTIVNLGKFSVGITAGIVMHGHTNGVRALIRIGPALWSGSDDGTIRIWSCADGECAEVIEDAHKGSVLKLAVVRSFVWSAGSDGAIKEWQLGTTKTTCIRKVAPPGSERGIYAIVPLGKDVWSCGHHPNIRVLSQHGMDISDEYPAHNPYVSNLLAIDRVETRIIWSSSIADRKLKVWRHTVRGNVPSMDELKAANTLYEKESQGGAEKLAKLLETVNALETQLEIAGLEYRGQLEDLSTKLAEEQAAKADVEEQRRFLEEEMAGLRRLFEEAGLGHLLQDPEALRSFLDLKRLFDEAGLGHLLNDHEALQNFLALGQVLQDLGLGRFLNDPEAFRAFLQRAAQIEEILRGLGLEDCLNDPRKLKQMLESFKQLKKVLEDNGFAGAVKDPSILTEVLSRYNMIKAAFDENGFSELFEDPISLKGWLRNIARIREEFRNVDLEYLMDSPLAMRDFLAKHKSSLEDLKELQALKDKCAHLENMLAKSNKDLAACRAELQSCKEELNAYKEICPTLDELRKMKEEAGQYRTLKKLKKNQDKELEEMRRLLEEKERERLEALEKERLMALKYKELDIFKLDIIARELKALDNELTGVGKAAKMLNSDAHRLRNMDEREQISPHGDSILDQCKDLRAHIRDVIQKCLNETQRMHIGVAIDDHLAAGELKDGGVMAGYVCEEIERPDHGHSKAARLCQDDALKRESNSRQGGRQSPTTLPHISSGRRTPSQTKLE